MKAGVCFVAMQLFIIVHGVFKMSPKLPLQFSAKVEIESHLVEDRSREYPPWQTIMQLNFDYVQKRVKATIAKGFDEHKTYIRHYDLKNEYMIYQHLHSDCQRAYLGESLPMPSIPETMEYQVYSYSTIHT